MSRVKQSALLQYPQLTAPRYPNKIDFMKTKTMYSVATNFKDDLISGLAPYPVKELYGKLNSDVIGGGRSSYLISKISRKKLIDHVLLARKNGIAFNYLLNAACLDNIETTRSGQKQIRELLDWICENKIESVTISNILLFKIIKKNYPQLKIRVSVFNGVDHLQKAKYWADLGVDTICLDSLTVNREFATLKSLRNNLSCNLELLVNNNCVQSCAISTCHMNLLAHSSQKNHSSGGFVIDHCVLECSKNKLKDPQNYLKSDWIRPEDIHLYEEMGFNSFKIVERNLPTPLMIQRVKAYAERRFEGNLLDLIQPYGQAEFKLSQKDKFLSMFRFAFLLNPFKVNVTKLNPLINLAKKRGMLSPLSGEPPIYIDNRKLDQFIDRFKSTGCRNINCEACNHCNQFAQNAITVNPQYQAECLSLYNEVDELLESGKLFL